MNYRRMYYLRFSSGLYPAGEADEAALPACRRQQPVVIGSKVWHKAKGRGPFRDLAPHYPIFRRPGSVPRSQLIVTSELSGAFGRSPCFPYFPSFHSLQELSRAIRRSRFPECVESFVSDSLASLVPDALRSSFPGSLASPASGSPGVPFPALLRVPLPVPLMALVFSLLLEDRSSVELKDTRNSDDCNGVGTLYFCGK